jgi:hypothetical protein
MTVSVDFFFSPGSRYSYLEGAPDVWPIDERACIAIAVELGMRADRFRSQLKDR